VEAAYARLREHVPPLGRDRALHRDIARGERLLRSGSLLTAAEVECGPLE
jgi:histidine ammonia-lyase